MPRQQIEIPRWTGLNLRGQPEGGALDYFVDGINTETQGGTRLRARRPFRTSAIASLSGSGNGWNYTDDANNVRVVLEDAGELKLYSTSSNTVLASSFAPLGNYFPTGAEVNGTAYGQPGSRRMYFAVDRNAGWVRLAGTAFSRPPVTTVNALTGTEVGGGAAPRPAAIAVWGRENRLVLGGFTAGATGPAGQVASPDHVWISMPGDPEKFRTSAFIRLTPGDGDKITAICAWRDIVIVFKQRKLFVLTHTTVDARGVETFNFETLDFGVGATNPNAVVATPQGVFFVAHDGLYRTDGQSVELVSPQAQPLWSGETTPFYTGPIMRWQYPPGMIPVPRYLAYFDQRLYMLFAGDASRGTGNDHGILVVDLVEGWVAVWKLWRYPNFLRALRLEFNGEIRETLACSPNFSSVLGLGAPSTAASGEPTAVYAMARTCFSNLGQDVVKRVAGVELTGKSTITTSLYVDSAVTTTMQQSTTLTATDATSDDSAGVRIGGRGNSIALAFSGSDWQLTRASLHVAGMETPSKVRS